MNLLFSRTEESQVADRARSLEQDAVPAVLPSRLRIRWVATTDFKNSDAIVANERAGWGVREVQPLGVNTTGGGSRVCASWIAASSA